MTWENFENIDEMVSFVEDKLEEVESSLDLDLLSDIFDLLDSVPFDNNNISYLYDRALDIKYSLELD